jgi:23S rRNA pseudouridine1911/1915/1917 synthase
MSAPHDNSFDAEWLGEKRQLQVDASQSGSRLVDFLTDKLVDLSSAGIQQLLKAGLVQVNGRAMQGGTRLRAADQVEVEIELDELLRIEPQALEGLSVIYEDESVLVVDKPSGVGVTPDRGELQARFLGACLRHLMEKHPADTPRPRVVHRLDKETSGAVLVACSREALRDLTEQFQSHSVQKDYLALVRGSPFKDQGTIELPIGRETHGSKLRAGGREAQDAKTRFEVVERFRGYALVRAWPETGRQHQIRVHLEAIGHPLAVDPVYGGGESLTLSSFKRKYVPNRSGAERPLIDRLSLHAERIRFRSPSSGAEVSVEAPLPKDFEVSLRQLRKWARDRQSRA